MRRFLYFALLIALSLAACIATFVQLVGGRLPSALLIFGINFPIGLLLCAIYYVVIFRLSRVPFFRRHRCLRILVDWLCVTAVGATISLAGHRLLDSTNSELTMVLTFILWSSIVALGVELYVYHRSVLEKEMLLARLEKEKAAYQFEALKQQMNPHFLFNSLNALASLAYQDAEKTNLFAKKLSCVYRYLLSTYERPLVTLKEELDFLDSYLFLEKIRFGDAFVVDRCIDDGLLSRRVVPVTLQTLVENALKHNVCTVERPLRISVRTEGEMLVVENNLQLRDSVASTGVGLQNLRRQYVAHAKTMTVNRTPAAFIVTIPLVN